MTGRLPFPNLRNEASVIVFVMRGGRPSRRHCKEIDDSVWYWLEECWNADPNERPSMAVLYEFLFSHVPASPHPVRCSEEDVGKCGPAYFAP
jgi:hypothetical protein